MHSEDVTILIVLGVIVAAIVAIVLVVRFFNRRRRARWMVRYQAACVDLGLERTDAGWVGERASVRVRVSWTHTAVGFLSNRYHDWFTSYAAYFDAPLHTGIVVYTGVETYQRENEIIHLARIDRWNDAPLPTGGRLRDVHRSPESATVVHTHIPNEELSSLVCLYARDPSAARALFSGPFAEAVLDAARASAFMWMDDAHLLLLVKSHGALGDAVTSGLVDLAPPHHDRATIDRHLDLVARLARNIRRASETAAGSGAQA